MTTRANPILEYDFAGARARVLLSGRDTGGAVAVMEMFAPPGKRTPMHRHAHEDESLVVLEGEVDVTIDGRPLRVRAGENAQLPRGSVHRIANDGCVAARYLLVCAPAGFEAFIEHVADARTGPVVPTPAGPAQVARMRAASEAFGITMLPG